MLQFRTQADLEAYMAQRKREFPWKIGAIAVFGLILLAIAALSS